VNGLIELAWCLDKQVNFAVARTVQAVFGGERGAQVNFAAGYQKNVNIATTALVICPRPKQVHPPKRVQRTQGAANGAEFGSAESHGVVI
jgi:hypothetical protein